MEHEIKRTDQSLTEESPHEAQQREPTENWRPYQDYTGPGKLVATCLSDHLRTDALVSAVIFPAANALVA